MISGIIKVLVRANIAASTFGSADKTYLDLDYSGYHKNLIQIVYCCSLQSKYELSSCLQMDIQWDTAKVTSSRLLQESS